MSTATIASSTAAMNLNTKTPPSTLQHSNIKRVQDLVAEFQNGRPEGYMAGVADDIKGSVLGGLFDGAATIENKEQFGALMGSMDTKMEVKKFEPKNWRAVNDDVFFNVDWTFVWKPTGETIDTTALVRKVVKNGMICEKYHMLDAVLTERLSGQPAPHSQAPSERVQALLAEYAAGRPEGYMAGVADDFNFDVLSGVLPNSTGTDKATFSGLMGSMDAVMEVSKFTPHNFRAMPNSDVIFNVDWTFVHRPTGKTVDTTAICRKVFKDVDGTLMLCEKYHMVDASCVGQTSPRDVIEASLPGAPTATALSDNQCAAPGFEDTTFATFVPSVKKGGEKVPVLLFQSGYGSSSRSHQPLLQAIADAGYVCVVPDRAGDTKGGKESVGKVFAGLAEGIPASEHNAMSTDGSHLAAALAWLKERNSVDGQPIDAACVAAAGFSMGCIEAIQFASAAPADVKAVAIISSSSGAMLEKLYAFEQAALVRACASFGCPSLWITSDLDSQKGATTELYDVAAAPASLLVFKDAALDNSCALTEKTSIWSAACNEMLPGLAQHFALAAEAKAVSAPPIVAFLDRHLKGAAGEHGTAAPLAAESDIAEQKDKPK